MKSNNVTVLHNMQTREYRYM